MRVKDLISKDILDQLNFLYGEEQKKIYRRLGFREDFDPNNVIVKQEDVFYNGTTYWVSTVDLGVDHNFLGGTPLYYETMVFKKNGEEINFHDLYCDRYSTREEALQGHNNVIHAFQNNLVHLDELGYFELR